MKEDQSKRLLLFPREQATPTVSPTFENVWLGSRLPICAEGETERRVVVNPATDIGRKACKSSLESFRDRTSLKSSAQTK